MIVFFLCREIFFIFVVVWFNGCNVDLENLINDVCVVLIRIFLLFVVRCIVINLLFFLKLIVILLFLLIWEKLFNDECLMIFCFVVNMR